jgi:hypothetical protein
MGGTCSTTDYMEQNPLEKLICCVNGYVGCLKVAF